MSEYLLIIYYYNIQKTRTCRRMIFVNHDLELFRSSMRLIITAEPSGFFSGYEYTLRCSLAPPHIYCHFHHDLFHNLFHGLPQRRLIYLFTLYSGPVLPPPVAYHCECSSRDQHEFGYRYPHIRDGELVIILGLILLYHEYRQVVGQV